MVDFWNEIEAKVSKRTGIDSHELKNIITAHENQIVDYLSHTCFPECDSSPCIKALKQDIFLVYTNDIAPLISKIEVYSHTLSADSVEAVFNLLQYITAAELSDTPELCETNLKITLSYARFLKFTLQKRYFELLSERLHKYRKMVKNYQHQGILIERKPFLQIIDNEMKQAKRCYYQVRTHYRSCLRRSNRKVVAIYLDKVPEDMGFSDPVKSLERIHDFFVDHLPSIVANGYRKTCSYRFFSWLFNGISVLFLLKWLWELFL